MERAPGLSIYHQSTAPAPLSDVVAPASAESVPVVLPPPVTHTAQIVLFVQVMCNPDQVVQIWVVIILRTSCIYMRSDLKSRSGSLTRRLATKFVPSLRSLCFCLDL